MIEDMAIIEYINNGAFALETVAHLQGKESELLPLADNLRKAEEQMKLKQEHEYWRLDKLYHYLEDRNLHERAEEIADRLSEMEMCGYGKDGGVNPNP